MEATPSPAERRKTSTTYKGKRGKRSLPTSNAGPTSDSEAEETKGDTSGAMAPPPLPLTKKIQQSPGVVRTPSKDHGSDVSGSGRTSFKADGSPLISRSGSVAGSLKGNDGQDDGRDDVSVAESSKGHRKTEEERLQFFHDQPDCREVEPHRAFCTGCDQWVHLNAVRRYVMRPWLVHRRVCRRASHTNKQMTPKALNKEEGAPDGSNGDDDVISAVQSASETPSRYKGEAERQAYLEGDPRSEEVRPYEVLCKTCKKWVQLGNKTRYSLGHWKDHQKRCSGSIPSSRVATAERKLKLVNDASAKSFSGTSVHCIHCDTTIALDGEGDYNLTKWQEHKATCPSSPLHEPVTQGTTTSVADISPSRSEKSENCPPVSTASTEATAVDTATSLGGAKKRQREPDEDDSETRPRTRAKTHVETPSGALGWLLLPFRSFVSGFKKGMGQASTPPGESMAT